MKIVLCGDLLFSSRNLAQRLDPKLMALLQNADAVFANAEFSTPKRETPPGRCMYLTSVPQDVLDELVNLNIRLVSFANNHIGDYGWQGALETLEAAEARKLIPCGLGRNLAEARKARFLDTSQGRVAVVAASTTWADRAMASMEGADVAARPGLCPLRWGHSYMLPDREFEELRRIDRLLGTSESMRQVSRVETWEPADANHFRFGSAMEGYLSIERGESACVRTWANPEDEEEILKSIADAAKRSDVVIASLHSHEGLNENWYDPAPPAFVEAFAHKAIDAGATVVAGHGAHFARGAEIYQGRFIFYNLGSLLMEFEAGESMISPEMYQTYNLPENARPSDLHGNRARAEDGSWKGFYEEKRFSQNYLVEMEFAGKQMKACRLIPLDLGMNREDCLRRGLPEIASPQAGAEIAASLSRMSIRYGTRFCYEGKTGTMALQ